MDQPTLIFVTIARPHCAIRLIESVRAYFPGMPIVMAEQVDGESELGPVCERHDVARIVTPFDTGVSACRNLALRAVTTDLVVLADDDFVFTDSTRFEKAIGFLETHPAFGFVGGCFETGEASDFKSAFLRGRNFAIDETGRGLVMIPATSFDHSRVEHEGETFVVCDMVAQWGVGRTELLRRVGWDCSMKTGGEHIDFFLRLKALPARPRVAFSTCIRARHQPESNPLYDALRGRDDWLDLYREKWGFDYILPAGGSFRPLADYGRSVPLWADEATAAMIERQAAGIAQMRQTAERQAAVIARKKEMIRQLRDQLRRSGGEPAP